MTDERRQDPEKRDRIDELFAAQDRQHHEFVELYKKRHTRLIFWSIGLSIGITCCLLLFGCQQRDNTKIANSAKTTADKVDRGLVESKQVRRDNYVRACDKRNKQNSAIWAILQVAPQDLISSIPKKDLEGLAQEACKKDAKELIK